jgi:fructose-1,6-bisphosphatase/sedoheptulose 1,7-bisphosphatase-like protein
LKSENYGFLCEVKCVILKRVLIFCAGMMLVMAADCRVEIRSKIKIGCGKTDRATSDMLLESIKTGLFKDENVDLVVYTYEDEMLMLQDLAAGKCEIICMAHIEKLLDQENDYHIKAIFETDANEDGKITVCVQEDLLETKPETAFKVVSIFNEVENKNPFHHIISQKEWLQTYIERGFESDKVMEYLALDFMEEIKLSNY